MTRSHEFDIVCDVKYDTKMARHKIVVDTNVLVAAFRSRSGASHRLLSLVGEQRFEICVSVPLVLEYEDVLSRSGLGGSPSDAQDVVDYLCQVASHHQIHFLWRPRLKDPKDEMVLELAVGARCDYIVTFNVRDFAGVEQFEFRVVRPIEFLRIIGEVP